MDATDLIKRHEGYKNCSYKDSKGHSTICYGFNLDRSNARSEITSVGGDFDKVYKGGYLNRTQCDTLLNEDIKVAERDEVAVFGTVCGCVKYVLVDMSYNLGLTKLKKFDIFISLIKAKEWKLAGEFLRKKTLWCTQVGTRCHEDATQIENGCLGNEIKAKYENNTGFVKGLIHF